MIYSPSQTKSYLECPTKRMLNQEGWTERIVGIRDWTAWTGQGVHAGLAACKGGRDPHPDIVSIGQDEFVKYYDHAIKSGRIIPGHLFYVGEAKAHIERCLEYAMKNDILPAGFEVERTEQTLGDYNCILDVVGKRNGKPTFIDWKVKNKLRLDYLDQELEKYRYDWKEARHYPWALSQVTGQRVEEYSVVMFILSPQFKVVQRTYEVNWPVVERWREGVQGLYDIMDGKVWYGRDYVTVLPWQSSMCHPPIGLPCEYLDACWTYNLDREKMKAGGLVQVERLHKQTLATSQEDQQGGPML